MKKCLFFAGCLLALASAPGQTSFTFADTLRGSLGPERAWWNVLRYDITVEPAFESKQITGSNMLLFEALEPGNRMQIDLQEPMQLDSALIAGVKLNYSRSGNAFFVDLHSDLSAGDTALIQLYFSGKPREARTPPWDGGWIWKKDKKGRPWVSVACQGLGASVWYPCKDHQSDEPDKGVTLRMIVPEELTAVSNGKLLSTEPHSSGKVAFTWNVENPINNYNVIPYIGHYIHWTSTYAGLNGPLSLDYWVLDDELEASKNQFGQVELMLDCFEDWFGPYPFYEDGFKLVQSPHLGMEHQSGIAYGNKFGNGYLGRDLSGSGWGMKWDFIIIHESGHEWFGNNITANDVADMWIHESFTAYSETIFTQCRFGLEAGNDYVIGTRGNILNDKPIIGPYGVNKEGSGDMYYKGANMLHTIRQVVNNDSLFKESLRGLNKTFYHSTVTSKQIEDFMSNKLGKDLSAIFDQYLRTVDIPILEFALTDEGVTYRWKNVVQGFNMPLKTVDGVWLYPGQAWKVRDTPSIPQIDRNFYIKTRTSGKD
jgi:aminopeptidase N